MGQTGFSTFTFPLGILKVPEFDMEPQLREGGPLFHPFSSNVISTGLLRNRSCFQAFRDALGDTPHPYLFALPDTVVQSVSVYFLTGKKCLSVL